MKRENEGESDGHHRAKLREAVTAGKAVKGGLKSERKYALVSTSDGSPGALLRTITRWVGVIPGVRKCLWLGEL